MRSWMRTGAVLSLATGVAASLLAAPAAAAPGPVPKSGAPARPTLRFGDQSDDVLTVQRRLRALHFDPGPVDGFYGEELRPALWAFKKVNRLAVTSDVDAATWRALASPRRIQKLVPKGGKRRVEISIARQLLVLYRKNQPVYVTHISTGARRPYCERGHCGRAITPRGDFRVFKKIPKWHRAPLGYLFKPLYFNGGIAMHGSTRVPRKPASHGCVRIPLTQAAHLYKQIPRSTPVYVR